MLAIRCLALIPRALPLLTSPIRTPANSLQASSFNTSKETKAAHLYACEVTRSFLWLPTAYSSKTLGLLSEASKRRVAFCEPQSA